MEAIRARFGALLEWGLAALCTLAIAGVGSFVFDGLRTASKSVVPVIAGAVDQTPTSEADAPAFLTAKAVSVPLILLSNGAELRVGERESAIAAKIRRAWQVGGDALERMASGNRISRDYHDGVRRFLLVYEPKAERAELRLSAIYLE